MTKKFILKITGALAILWLPLTTTQAIPITGGLSMSGGFMAVDSGGNVTSDLTLADKLLFGPDTVNEISATKVKSRSGSFTAIAINSTVKMASPLDINPAVAPIGPIWSVGGPNLDQFSLTLSSLDATVDLSNTLTLKGVGVLSSTLKDSQGALLYDDTPGTWTATFNSAVATFSWSSSSGATAPVPDRGGTLVLLGFGLAGVGFFGRFRCRWA
jgi:hypothetical protein